ncbi:MAG: hypothetical protein MUO36_02440, partial [Candidatus Hadarchaeum sp.]|nr:hypothetical protein [Candidatus Hadarchaeum sp.]
MNLSPDQLQERRELLQQCLNMSVIQAQSYANSLSEEQFIEAINGTTRDMLGMNMRPPAAFPDNYFGQYYTIQNGKLQPGNVWDQVELDILQCLTAEREAREVLEYFLNQPGFQADFTVIKARFRRWRNTLDSLLGFKLIRKLPGTAKDVTTYALYAEMIPLLRRVLASPKSQELPVINSEAAQAELAYVQQMEKEFEEYLSEEIDLDAVGRVRVLVEREHDHVAGGQQVEDPVERAPLADDAEARLVEAARDERIEPGRLDRATDEMEPAAEVRIVGEAGDRG